MKITHNKVGQNLSVRDNVKDAKSSKPENTAGAKGSAGADGLKNISGNDSSTSALKPQQGKVSELGASKVNLSERAMDIKKAKDIARATPDVNEEKVAALQKLIDEGNYRIPADDIADKMVNEQLLWE